MLIRLWPLFFVLLTGRIYQAAFWYGLIVHFRIYPIIYALPIVLVLDPQYIQPGQKPILENWSSHKENSHQHLDDTELKTLWSLLTSLFCWTRILFGLISGAIFLGFTGLFYYLYGWEFLYEALLYHLTRTDPRHNFSIYFYHIYLHYEHEFSILEKLVSFLPQFSVQLVLMFRFALDLPFCFLVQTVAFVAFNKVCDCLRFISPKFCLFFCLVLLCAFSYNLGLLDKILIFLLFNRWLQHSILCGSFAWYQWYCHGVRWK